MIIGNYFLTLRLKYKYSMLTPFIINRFLLTPQNDINHVINMNKRCAFALCVSGNFDIEIMNLKFHIESNSIIILMPFVNIKLLNITQPTETIIVEINRENVIGLSPIHRYLISNNLMLIRQRPVVNVTKSQILRIKSEIEEYTNEVAGLEINTSDEIYSQIYQSIIESRSQLITSEVLKLYFTNIPIEFRKNYNHGLVFQRFMLDVYANYREHHNVRFYALRSGLSLKYFSTIIREHSGASPSEWIEGIIICEIQSMLHNPQNSIKEVAVALNFPDAAAFTKYVVRITGHTPKELRKTISN